MNLSKAEINRSYKIINLHMTDKKLSQRLKELGLYNNSIIKVIKYSPLKKTILIELLNSVFALKTEIAKQIEINRL